MLTFYWKTILLSRQLLQHKVKLSGNAGGANRIVKNAAIAASLKYLSNFLKSLEMSLINCKAELKLKWIKYCVLSATGKDNDNDKNNNIIFNIKDAKLHVPVATLSARDNQELSKRLSKGFERSVYWNEYKTKSDNKNMTNEYRYFIKSDFAGVNRLFVLIYSNQDNNSKRFKAKRYYLLKGIINNYNVIINGKNFYD